ncbi:type II toxin-antitoxin system VapB family antitoxin [Halioxenophilus aromaticivorans]|uniref:AbrB/MazE/SpoVT family DNA-binding domain-containing protein n=1 Tax=Halioxenophilus aromaticivorans TaxID=1306992 RepID=A0AAV3TZW1_9ALTE
MRIASLFKHGRTQAVRLPKEFEFVGITEVEISCDGNAIALKPSRKPWTSLIGGNKAGDDFVVEREDFLE